MWLFSWIKKCQGNFNKYQCTSCNKDDSNIIDEELKTRFKEMFKFSEKDVNKCILLLRKKVFSLLVYGWMRKI